MEQEAFIVNQEPLKSNWLEDFKSWCVCVFVLGILVSFLIVFLFGFDVAGLSLAIVNNNTTCYDDRIGISLSVWLIVVNSASIMFVIFMVVSSILMCVMDLDYKYIKKFYELSAMVFIALHFFANIYGIIGLAEQFDRCKEDILVVCVMVIITMVAKTVICIGFTVGLCYAYTMSD